MSIKWESGNEGWCQRQWVRRKSQIGALGEWDRLGTDVRCNRWSPRECERGKQREKRGGAMEGMGVCTPPSRVPWYKTPGAKCGPTTALCLFLDSSAGGGSGGGSAP